MFGGKKAKLKEKLIDGDPDIIEEVYKFYDYDKPQDKIELQAYLNCNNAYKVIVILNSGKETTIEYLCIKIAEQMENFQEFENLEGLKAVNLSKKTEKGIVKLPISGEIDNFINDGDIVYCDLNTDEYWVKTTIKMNSGSSLLLINLDIKFRLDTIIKKLRFLLMKLGINFWIDTASQVKDYNHYIFTSLNFKTLKSKNNIDYSVSDLKKGLSIEKKKVSDILDFHSEIQFSVSLISLEELYFNKLKNTNSSNKPSNKVKWNEFKELTLNCFFTNPKFVAEKKFFQSFIKRLIMWDQKNPKKSFYLYNRNYSVKTHKIIEDDDLEQENSEELSNLIILPYDIKQQSNDFSPNKHLNKEINTSRKASIEEGGLAAKNDGIKNSIVIHKSEMKLYSNDFYCVKNHKDSICSMNTYKYNKNTNNYNSNLDLSVSKCLNNEELVSNYNNTNEDDQSYSSCDFLAVRKNKNFNSFHENSKIIHEFNTHLEKEDSNSSKNEKIVCSDRHNDTFYENCRESFKKLSKFKEDPNPDATINLSSPIKAALMSKKNYQAEKIPDKTFDNLNNKFHYKYKNEVSNANLLNSLNNGFTLNQSIIHPENKDKVNVIIEESNQTGTSFEKDVSIKSIVKNILTKASSFSMVNSESDDENNQDHHIKLNSKFNEKEKEEYIFQNNKRKIPNTNQTGYKDFDNLNNEDLYKHFNYNSYNRKNFFSCQFNSKLDIEEEEEEAMEKAIRPSNLKKLSFPHTHHQKNKSLNQLQFKSDTILNVNQFILDNSLTNENYEKSGRLNNNSKNDNINPTTDEKNTNNMKLSKPLALIPKHKSSLDLKRMKEENIDNPSDINNDTSNNNKSNQLDSNNRKQSFFFNFRNQGNLVKDLRSIVKAQNFKDEIEKFSELKISRHILERIIMPPFRTVQIERKSIEEATNYDLSKNSLDEPLRINIRQILSFLIFLILLFVIAVLVIFLTD